MTDREHLRLLWTASEAAHTKRAARYAVAVFVVLLASVAALARCQEVRIEVPTAPIPRGGAAIVTVHGLTTEQLDASGLEIVPDLGIVVIQDRRDPRKHALIVSSDALPGPRAVKVALNPWLMLLRGAVTLSSRGMAESDRQLLAEFVADVEKRYEHSETSALLTVAGNAPQPPVVNPDVIDPPVVPTPGKRVVAIIHESQETTPQLAQLKVKIRTGPIGQYLFDKGHTLLILEDDHGTVVKPWMDLLQGVQLPAVVIKDPASPAVIAKRSIMVNDTADTLLSYIRQHGG